ncbi:hypothetical protein BGW36DRAFT_394608 [Talaromyces proteolyticus]|uniref:BHLH domain-containing protein n=1 Tax=Talaromyces proteolyticus TaxID=1131652 RepID=A0AAD4KWL8_9EURO|nr:uncharacterized protein BGW36DRAFT_394608 [Talaromyces proteolyticus]KAH8701799.1 hypothetical protein BGW36DRAFT_394608 [Talaromyces proteolyticus]
MTCYQPTSELFDLTRPMMILPDDIDPSNLLTSTYAPPSSTSPADWIGKDCSSFDFLPWELSGDYNNDPIFDMSEEIADGLEFPKTYPASDNSSPMGYKGYTVKTEDALSYASPVSDGESDTWSPMHNNGSNSPAAVAAAPIVDVKNNMPSPLSNHRHTRMPSATTIADSKASSAIPVAAAIVSSENIINESSPRSRKSSNSSSSSSLSPSHSTSRPGRSSTASGTDPTAAMKRKKAAHNAIEKRYRTNMNAKFLALGNAIPRPGPFATQLASNKGSRKHSLCQSRDPGAVGEGAQQQQQNKSEILTNALSYIHELQEENSRLKGELMVLKENLLPRGGNVMWRR